MFSSLIQWNVWHNQSNLGILFFFPRRDKEIAGMKRDEGVKISEAGIVIKWGFTPWTRECQWSLKGKASSQCRLSLHFSGPCEWPSGLSYPFVSQRWQAKGLKRNTLWSLGVQNSGCSLLFYDFTFPAQEDRIDLRGSLYQALMPPPIHFSPPIPMISWWVRGSKYFGSKEWIILCSVYCKVIGCFLVLLETAMLFIVFPNSWELVLFLTGRHPCKLCCYFSQYSISHWETTKLVFCCLLWCLLLL